MVPQGLVPTASRVPGGSIPPDLHVFEESTMSIQRIEENDGKVLLIDHADLADRPARRP